MEITPNGILMTTDYQGRSSGEAFVQFRNKGFAERALEKNKESIGHRWGRKEGTQDGKKAGWKQGWVHGLGESRRQKRKLETEFMISLHLSNCFGSPLAQYSSSITL